MRPGLKARVAILALLCLIVGAPAHATLPIGEQFRVSTAGVDGDASRGAFDPAVAYSSQANEYLVVWGGEGFATDDEFEIFGQRVSASGVEVGGDFQISTTGTDGDPNREAGSPSVAHNTQANEYLVVWPADGLPTDDKWEVFGQRLSASGAELGGDFRISNTGTEGDASTDVFDRPAVVYNSQANEYLVVWLADGLGTNDELEIFGQRLSAAGAELGGDFRISTTGTDGDTARAAGDPAVAYSPQANEYLVAWHGDGLATDNENEVFGQRLSATGAELGTDFRISSRAAVHPAVTHNSQANEYLVVWRGSGATDVGLEVFGQRLSASGEKVGADLRISTTGNDGEPGPSTDQPAVAYEASSNEYLVTWNADGLATNKFEIFGQRLRADGAELDGDFRISTTGTDTDAARDALSSTVAASAGNQYLVAWYADALLTDNETEIFARRVGEEPAPPTAGPCTITGTAGNDVIMGTPGNDYICALGGRDRVSGGGGNDRIVLGPGRDRAFGGPGRDVILGGKGPDRISGGGGRDRLFGERGRDVLLARDRVRDLVHGGRGFDRARVDRRRDTRRSIESLF
jgi:Ca2+-binding RTX toxin-like protein